MHKAMWLPHAALILWLGLGLACGGKDEGSSSPTDGIPDPEALTLELTPADAVAVAAAPAAVEIASPAPADWPTVPDDLAAARARIAEVNAGIRSVFDHVAAVALQEGAPWRGDGKWYGPADRCTVETSPCPAGATATFRLWVGNAIGRGGAFALQAKAVGADDASYRTVVAGWMRRGPMARRGVGQIWMELFRLKAAAPAFPGEGALYAGFAAGPIAKAETMVLSGFTPDATRADRPAITGAFRGFKTAAGVARVRFARTGDFLAGAAGDELELGHVVHDAALGGRAYAIVAHGDVPAGRYDLGRACYAAGQPEAPVFKEWFSCDAATQGPARCIADAGGAGAVVVGSGTWDGNCRLSAEPGEFAPPGDGDLGTADGVPTDPLPGEGAAGLTPETAPTSGDGAPTPG